MGKTVRKNTHKTTAKEARVAGTPEALAALVTWDQLCLDAPGIFSSSPTQALGKELGDSSQSPKEVRWSLSSRL